MKEENVSGSTETKGLQPVIYNNGTAEYKNLSVEKPKMINKFENIPEYLKPLKQWLLWEFVLEKEDWTKKPLCKWSNPDNLMTFNDVIIARNDNKDIGIGFVFTNDNDIIGIDIDKCVDVNNKLTMSIDRLTTLINGYTEVSPSGFGLHIIGRVVDKIKYKSSTEIKYPGCDHIEFYSSGRYFTFTGFTKPDLPQDIGFIDENKLALEISSSIITTSKDGNIKSERFELPIDVPEGGRNKLLFKAACSLRSKGLGKTEIMGALKETNKLRCSPPLSIEELEVIIGSACGYTPSNPIVVETAPVVQLGELVDNDDDVIFDMKDLPDNHIIKNYVSYGESIQDAYPEYHMINIMTLLSNLVISKNTPVFGDIYNNMWFIGIGRAGESGKSSALTLCERMVNDISQIYIIHRMSDKPTPESFIELLSEQNKRLMMTDEISGFFKYLKRDYAKEMIEYILQTYSHGNISRSTITKKGGGGGGGIISCVNPHISMLWYTTPDAFNKNVDGEWYFNGFCQRPMYIIAKRRKNFMLDRSMTEADRNRYNKIVDQCLELRKYSQDKYIIFEENEILNAWKNKSRESISGINSDIKRSAITRSYEHSRKLAMILTLGSDEFISWLSTKQGDKEKIEGWVPPTLVFNIPDWAAKLAIKWSENFIENFHRVYKSSMLDNSGSISKLKCALKEADNGWLKRSDCQDIVHKYGRQFDEMIFDLINEGMVENQQLKTKGRTASMYKWIGD